MHKAPRIKHFKGISAPKMAKFKSRNKSDKNLIDDLAKTTCNLQTMIVSNRSVYNCMRSCTHKVSTICLQMLKSKKGNNFAMRTPTEKKKKKKKKKKNMSPLIFLADAIYEISGS